MDAPLDTFKGHQGVRLLTVGVAGPALIWAGYKYPGTGKSKVALALLGAALIYLNYNAMQAEFEKDAAP